MKNLLLTLLSLLVTAVAFAAVPSDPDPISETTSAPNISYMFVDEDMVEVLIENTDEPGARLYYHVNGDDWQEYNDPIVICGSGYFVVEAYATVDGKMDSYVSTVEFIIQEPPVPEVTPAPYICYEYDESLGAAIITIVDDSSNGAELYYRFYYYSNEWQNEEISEWMLYDGPIAFFSPGRYRVEAYAIAPGCTASEMAVMEFVVLEPEPPQPIDMTCTPTMAYQYKSFLPPLVEVTVDCEEVADLYYCITVDGEMSEWMQYTGPIYFSTLGQYYVQSYAVAPGKLPSDMCAIMFDVVEPPMADKPTIVATYNGDGSVDVSIMSDAGYDQTFYYSVNDGEWNVYYDPIRFTEPGAYTIMAYATEENMMPSEVVSLSFIISEVVPYDFVEDGIYYKITGDGKVKVTFESVNYNSYSGVVNIPKTVTHNGVTYLVTAIGDNAFNNCGALTGVTIGGYVTSIGEAAFSSCTALTSVEIGNYVITLANDAFSNCEALTTVTLGSGVRSIGNRVFAGCNSLETINCKPAVPPTVGNGCFGTAIMNNAILNVYPAVLESYQDAIVWKLFAHIQGSEGIDPAVGDVDGDGEVGISDVSSLIDLLLNQ